MLTPVEIQAKTFKSGGLGYDKKDVESFMREVNRSYEILYRENMELKDKVAVLNEGIQYYKSIEKTLQKALVLAEKTAETTKAAANKDAKRIEKEAKVKANILLADAKNELELGTLELQEQIEEKKAENAKATFEEITQYAQQGFQGLGGMFDNVYTAIERTYELQVKEGKMTEKEAEKELEKYRGVKAAAAAMDALGSAVGAYNSLASIPYVGPALGAAAAAAALAAGFANVKLILATTKDNAGVGGADTYSPNLSEFTPQFVANATGRDDTDYLVNALEEKPLRAYIVESEVTAAQELENKRNQETTW